MSFYMCSSLRFGALELEPYKKRQSSGPRKKRDKEEGTSSRPKEVEELTEEEESTTKDVQHVWKYVTKACREKGRVGYLNFLVDPESFARTVENMFHFSFLIKDGRMGVMLGRDGLPYIYIRKIMLLVFIYHVICHLIQLQRQ